MGRPRIPRHVGIIPDGHRRWARARGLPPEEGYAHGIEPGLRLLRHLRERGVEELSIYGFTKENVRRPGPQVRGFSAACVEFADRAVACGAALRVIGDARSPAFPDALRTRAARRSAGDLRVNLLVNYGWRWDLFGEREGARRAAPRPRGDGFASLGSADVGRVDLVLRWGGCCRLSGFLPVQCAYADLRVIDTLWPDMQEAELHEALAWYQDQDVTLGG